MTLTRSIKQRRNKKKKAGENISSKTICLGLSLFIYLNGFAGKYLFVQPKIKFHSLSR
jgi:hypothetical protein